MSKLADNFTLDEFSVSASRPDLAEPVPEAFIPNARRLAGSLQFIRNGLGGKTPHIGILSGYRSEALNNAVKGSPTSQHRSASAVDFHFKDGRSMKEAFEWLMHQDQKLEGMKLGQVIYYPDKNFVHIALPSRRFPAPTFCIHWPRKKMRYKVVRSLSEMRRLLAA